MRSARDAASWLRTGCSSASACNLHCTGCWAAEYEHKLNLSLEELDNVIKQGKKLDIYFYMYTEGEPLVRKDDLIRLCEMNPDCAFVSFTNGTLVDQAFCDELKRVGNLSLAMSLEEFHFRRFFGHSVLNVIEIGRASCRERV